MAKNLNSPEARDTAHHMHAFTHLPSLAQDGPLVLESGEGIYVKDIHGKSYIEGVSGLWHVVAGFNEKRLIDAAYAQMQRMPAYHTFFGRSAMPVIELAERMIELAPMPTKKVFFVNSGSESNDTAIKILWMIARHESGPAKRKLISRSLAYHGTTIGAGSLNGKPYINAFGLPLPEVVYAECPHYWRHGRPGESEEAYATRLAESLEALILAEGADTIAGFFAEPVMGAGGALVPPKGYFEKIAAVLKRHGIPFVADEVVCGFGRTGNLWGAQTFNFTPDIVISSKALTSGYFPMGAVLLSPEIEERLMAACAELEEFPHGFTTGGHPVAAAVALETIAMITEPGGLFENLCSVTPAFQASIQALADHPLVGEARGIGLIGALEIVADKGAKAPFAGEHLMSERIVRAAHARGLILRPIGDSVIFAPPFMINEEQIGDMFERTRLVLDEVNDMVVREHLGPAIDQDAAE